VFKLLLEPIKPRYAAGILFSATFSIKNGVSNWAKFPNSVYPKLRLYCNKIHIKFAKVENAGDNKLVL
jgi:hypothetical protein